MAAIWSRIDEWTGAAPILEIGAVVLVLMATGAVLGGWLRAWHEAAIAARRREREDVSVSATVTAVLTLLALLLGFAFNLSMERFETRRQLVVDEANAIGTTYLRAQLLPEPDRSRLTRLLIAYTDNRIALARAGAASRPALRARNDALVVDIWAATLSAVDARPSVSTPVLLSTNQMIDLGTTRRAARHTHVPSEVFVILFVYMIVTAGLLGYLLTGFQGRLTAALVLALMAMFLLLVVDIDRPLHGGTRETQAPMVQLRDTLAAQPPQVFDRYRSAAAG